MPKIIEKGETNAISFGAILIKSRSKYYSKNHSKNDHQKNIEFDAKGVPKGSQNQCSNSSKNNAKTCNEKDHENHQNSCFSEW